MKIITEKFNKFIITTLFILVLLSLCGISFSEEEGSLYQDIDGFISKVEKIIQKGKTEQAIELYRDKLNQNLSPDDRVEIAIRLSQIYSSLSKNEEGTTVLEKTLKAYPGTNNEPKALLILGMEYCLIGKSEKAIEYFTRIKDLYPGSRAAGIASRHLMRLEDKNLTNFLSESYDKVKSFKNLSPIEGYGHIFYMVFKPSILQFLIITFIAVIALLFSNFKWNQSYNKGAFLIWDVKDILYIAGIILFIRPIVIITYLLIKCRSLDYFIIYNELLNLAIHRKYPLEIISIILSTLIIFVSFKNKIGSFKYLFFKDLSYTRGILVSIFLSYIITTIILLCICLFVFNFFPFTGSIRQLLFRYSMTESPLDSILYFSLFNPFKEELFFRGVFFQGLLRKSNYPIALILSSLGFSLYYLNFSLPSIIFFFSLGTLLILVYRKFGLFHSFILHSLYKFVIYLL